MEFEDRIDLVKMAKFLLKRCYWIILAAVVFGIIGLTYSKVALKPKYDASTRVYILNQSRNDMLIYSDIQSSRQLADDYEILITGENVTNEVVSQLGLNMTGSALRSMISVSIVNETRILQINVRDTDPVRAAEIANCVRTVAAEQIVKVMGVNAVNLVYEATVPKAPSSPNVKRNTMMAAAAGGGIVAVILAILFLMDDTMKTEEDVMQYLQLNTIGMIPTVKSMNKDGRRRR